MRGAASGGAQPAKPEKVQTGDPLVDLEEALELVATLHGAGRRLSVTEAKQVLRDQGSPAAASKLGKLTKIRKYFLKGH